MCGLVTKLSNFTSVLETVEIGDIKNELLVDGKTCFCTITLCLYLQIVQGQEVCVLEAMKMQNSMGAGKSGIVSVIIRLMAE